MQSVNLIFITLGVFLSILQTSYSQQELLDPEIKEIILKQVQYKYFIFTAECYDTFFSDLNWLHFNCLKMTAVKFIGYGLVMGGAIIKFPQIIKIISAKSVVGLSFTAVIFQLSTNILATCYCLYKNNPFSLYGQNVFIGVQMLGIIFLFVLFGQGNKYLYLFSLVLMMVLSYYASDPHHIPSMIIQHSIVVQTILICISRLSQIIEVYRIKSTGSLAMITWVLTVLGNMARIITIFVEASHDYKFLLSILIVFILNSFILFQFFLYRKNTAKL